MSFRSARLYIAFAITYLALVWTAHELHWRSAIFPSAASMSRDGKLIGFAGNVGWSRHKSKFYLFDDKLSLVKELRLSNMEGQHSISEDGNRLLYLANSATGQVTFELRSLKFDASSVQVHTPIRNQYGAHAFDIELVGTSLAHFDSDGMKVIDLSGQIVDTLDPSQYSQADSSPGYVATIESQGSLVPPVYYITCFSVSMDGFTEEFREPQSWGNRNQILPVLINDGHLAIQEENRIRIIDFNQADESAREHHIPWLRASGYLEAISASGKTLVFENTSNELLAVSSSTGSIVSRVRLDKRLFHMVKMQRVLLNDKCAYYVVFNSRHDAKLVMWDWNASTTKLHTFGNLHIYTEIAFGIIYLGCIAIWGITFFMITAKRQAIFLGTLAILASGTLLLFFLHGHPLFESTVVLDIILSIAGQVVLSLATAWMFLHLRFAWAVSLTLCGTTGLAYLLQTSGELTFEPYTFILPVFGIATVVAQSLLLLKDRQRFRLSLMDYVMLIAAVAISTRLLMLASMESILLYRSLLDLRSVDTLVGLSLALLTVLASKASRVRSRWFFAIQLALAIALHIVAVNYGRDIHFLNWGLNLTGTLAYTALGSVITWFLLNLVYRFLEYPRETSIPSTPLPSLPT